MAKPVHVLLFPFPAQGHILPMLNLAELLSRAGLAVTFLNTEHLHARFSRTSGAVDRLSRLPRFRFRTIPDGLPKDDPRPFLKLLDVVESMSTRGRGEYKEILASSTDGWPPVTCVVADGFLPLALEVAEELRIPTFMLRTSSACSVWAYYSVPELIKKGELPFKDTDDWDKQIQGVAGMESFLRRRDLPSFVGRAESINGRSLQFVMTVSSNLPRAKALILNTVESIEAPVLSRIRSVCPVTYTVGPLHTLISTFSGHEVERVATEPSTANVASLWQEDRTCLSWLDSRPPKSVVYVSFGSLTVLSREELLEFWHGLVNSGHPFLWVARPDLVEAATLSEPPPPEVEAATKERGCLVEWAPQPDVLAHPAVGCFLTHSGWNSTLESIALAVPMVCWPFIGDQQINSRYVSEVWRIGVDMKDTRRRDVVERMVREVMDGVEMRRRAAEMAETARESVEEGGSSYENLQRLIQHIKTLSTNG